MSLLQLLLAFVACMAAAFATGGLFAARARLTLMATALGSTAGFIASSNSWPNAVMLSAIAVAGLGIFTASVWLLTRLIGLEPRGRNAALRPDSTFPADAASAPPVHPSRGQPEHMAPT